MPQKNWGKIRGGKLQLGGDFPPFPPLCINPWGGSYGSREGQFLTADDPTIARSRARRARHARRSGPTCPTIGPDMPDDRARHARRSGPTCPTIGPGHARRPSPRRRVGCRGCRARRLVACRARRRVGCRARRRVGCRARRRTGCRASMISHQ